MPIIIRRATQSPRIYVNHTDGRAASRRAVIRPVYIAMNIYRCFGLDYDLKLPDFKMSRTEALINAIPKMSLPGTGSGAITFRPHYPCEGSELRGNAKIDTKTVTCKIIFNKIYNKKMLEQCNSSCSINTYGLCSRLKESGRSETKFS